MNCRNVCFMFFSSTSLLPFLALTTLLFFIVSFLALFWIQPLTWFLFKKVKKYYFPYQDLAHSFILHCFSSSLSVSGLLVWCIGVLAGILACITFSRHCNNLLACIRSYHSMMFHIYDDHFLSSSFFSWSFSILLSAFSIALSIGGGGTSSNTTFLIKMSENSFFSSDSHMNHRCDKNLTSHVILKFW